MNKIEEMANEVYCALGPGHTEYVYQKALLVELRLNNIHCEEEVPTTFLYKGEVVGHGRVDIVAKNSDGDMLALELKAIKDIWPNSYYKLDVYMKSLKIGRGLTINFPQRLGRVETEVRRFKCTSYC